MTQAYDYDLFVIGAGSGGLACAKRAASYGAKVAIAENSQVGGTCVIRGCVPKKIMAYAGQFADAFEDAVGYGFPANQGQIDFGAFVAKRNTEINRLNKLHITNLEKAGVTLINGHARFVDQHTLDINGKKITANYIVIATGSRPFMPNIPGIEHAISSDGVWDLTKLPERLAIVGGGYIGVEFASIFNALGSEVHLIVRRDTLLGGFDDDICSFTQNEMIKRNINLHPICNVEHLSKDADGCLCIKLDNNDEICADVALFATGRTPNTDQLDLENANISTDKSGAINVSKHLQSLDTIYAIGDATNRVNLTPVAIRDGRIVADNLFGNKARHIDDETIPSAVFSTPQVGTVGLTQAQAEEKYGADNITCHNANFKPMLHSLSGRDERILMKLVVHTSSNKVLGAHMAGKDAAEIIQALAVAVKMGATIDDLHATMPVHPSTAEEFVLLG